MALRDLKECNTGALIIRIGFGGGVYYTTIKIRNPPN